MPLTTEVLLAELEKVTQRGYVNQSETDSLNRTVYWNTKNISEGVLVKSVHFSLNCSKCRFRLFCFWYNDSTFNAKTGLIREKIHNSSVSCNCLKFFPKFSFMANGNIFVVHTNKLVMETTDDVVFDVTNCAASQSASKIILKNACVVCNISVETNESSTSKERKIEESIVNSQDDDDVLDDFLNLLNESQHCDIKVVSGDRQIMAHKGILASRSPVFQSMFKHNSRESQENQIVINDVKPEALNSLLQYIYTGRIADLPAETLSSLFSAADKYALPKLKQRCSRKLSALLSSENVLNTLVIGHLHEDKELEEAAAGYVLEHALDIMDSDEWMTFLKEYSQLANSVILRLAKMRADQR